MIAIINQIYEIQRKSIENDFLLTERNINRLFHELDEMGYRILIPLNEPYNENRTDIDARLMNTDASKITKVIKPVIYQENDNQLILLQKGIVIVE